MIGYEGNVYYKTSPLTATPDRTGWTLLEPVKDVTTGDETEDADDTTRANAGRKAYDYGLRDNTIDIELKWDTSDAGFAVLQAAYIAKTFVAVAILDAVIETGKGPAGNWMIANFTRNEPIGGPVTVIVSLRPNAYMGDLT